MKSSDACKSSAWSHGVPEPRGRLAQVGLAVLASAAGVSLALSQSPAGWLMPIPAAISLAWRVRSARPGVLTLLKSCVWIAVIGVAVIAVLISLYPVLHQPRIGQIARAIGPPVVLLTAIALIATPILNPARGVVPLSIALIAVASFSSRAPLLATHIAAACGVVIYLLGTGYRSSWRQRLAGPRGARLAMAMLGVVIAAYGVALALPWAQPRVEQLTANLLEPGGLQARAGFSDTSRLGDIETLALSRKVVLRVWGDNPPRKLRGRVLTRFDGRRWQGVRATWSEVGTFDEVSVPADLAQWLSRVSGVSYGIAAEAARADAARTLIVPVGVAPGEVLFAPAVFWAFRADIRRLRRDLSGNLDIPSHVPSVYALVHTPHYPTVPTVADGGDDPAALAAPTGLDPRIRALAASLAEGTTTASERVRRTLEHLQREYRYALSMGAFTTRDPLAEFLFEKKAGWCEYFASAAALLLRLQGVPARYVTGFSLAGATRAAGHYVVRESDAHAWIDVYIPERGWVEADPTPAAEYAAVHAAMDEGVFGGIVDYFGAVFAELKLLVQSIYARRIVGPVAIVVALALVAAAIIARSAFGSWRRRRKSRSTAEVAIVTDLDPDIRALAKRIERLWVASGQPRPRHRAPLEHLDSVAPRLSIETRSVSQAVVDCLYRARYAGDRVPPAEIERLGKALDSLGA
jgi:transglutaminase-like putative cysteine protease